MKNVFLVCSGLGNVKRGFETFTQECFNHLSHDTCLSITLFKGGGESLEKEIVLWNLPRDNATAIQLGKIIKRHAYLIEQVTFFISLVPYLYRDKPDIIYFSDGNLGNILWHWKRLTKQCYKLLFCNGGPLLPPFPRWDHIQQVAPSHLQLALSMGEPLEKQSLVPYASHIPSKLQVLTSYEREVLRYKLGLPEKQPLFLSVAAINKSHKRMDYVIRELASLPEPRPYLLLLGQLDAESPKIIQLGNELLGANNFQVKTVMQHEVAQYYIVSDAFVLASLNEGFGIVLLEAMSYGLPCLAHDYELTRFILEEKGYLADLNLVGNLASLINQALVEGYDEFKRRSRHSAIYERFSWEKMHQSYVEMIQNCAANT